MAGLVPAIHVFLACSPKDVDARHKSGHDVIPSRLHHAELFRLLPSDASPSSGFLKYMHHFGRELFSKPEEHWVLQASLTHSVSGELFSLVSVLDASALASED